MTSTATVTVYVGIVIARNDSVVTDEDVAVEIPFSTLTANDYNTASATVVSVSGAVDGTAALVDTDSDSIDDAVRFTPGTNFSGTASFVYTLEKDDASASDDATVTVTVLQLNDPPTVDTNVALNVGEGSSLTVSTSYLSASDPDPEDGDDDIYFTVASLAALTNGDLRLSGGTLRVGDTFTQADLVAGNVSFRHDGSEDFDASFGFRLYDPAGSHEDGTFTIAAVPVNDPPVLDTYGLLLDEGASASLATLIDTSDRDGVGTDRPGTVTQDALTLSLASLPTNGVVQLDGTALDATDTFTQADVDDGNVVYVHDGSETLSDSFDVEVDDDNGGTDSGTVSIEIYAVNDDPIIWVNSGVVDDPSGNPGVQNVSYAVYEGETATLDDTNLDALDPDNSADQLQFRITDNVANGTLRLGTTVLGVNSAFTRQDLLDGSLSYRHDGSETSSDSFDYILSDAGGGNEPSATFEITIQAVNDAPTIELRDDAISVNEDVASAIDGVTVADDDAGTSDLTVTLTAGSGTLTASDAGGATVTGSGTGTLGVVGTASEIASALSTLEFTAAQDATGTVTVEIVANDGGATGTDPDDPALAGLTFQPALTDDGDTDVAYERATATLTVDVVAVNDAPVVSVPASASVDEDADLTLTNIAFTDVDALDADTVRVTLSTSDLAGSDAALTPVTQTGLTVSGSGSRVLTLEGAKSDVLAALGGGVTYRAPTNFYGSDALSVLVSDLGATGLGGTKTDADSIPVTVNAVNDAPTVTPLTWTVAEDGSLDLSLASNDVDDGTDSVDDAQVTHYHVKVYGDEPGIDGLNGVLETSDADSLTAEGNVVPSGWTGTLAAGEHIVTVAQATNMTYTPAADDNSALPIGETDWRSKFEFAAIDVLDTSSLANSSQSGTETGTVTIGAVNDEPVLSGTSDTVTYAEGDGPQAPRTPVVLNASNDLSVADVEIVTQDVDDFGSARLRARRSGGPVASDRLGLASTVDVSGTVVSIGGTTVANVTDDSATGTLEVVFTADATKSDVDTVLRAVTYASADDDFEGSLTIDVTFYDGNEGAQGSGGEKASDAVSFTVNVTNVNDSPTFEGDGAISESEEARNAGSTIDAIMAAAFDDIDAPLDGSTFDGVAIVGDAADAAAEGAWQYSTDGGTSWHDVSPSGTAPTGSNALLLDTATALRFAPVTDFNSVPGGDPGSLTVRPIDDSGSRTYSAGATRTEVDLTGLDGVTSDVGSDEASIGATVTQVNDAPTISTSKARLLRRSSSSKPSVSTWPAQRFCSTALRTTADRQATHRPGASRRHRADRAGRDDVRRRPAGRADADDSRSDRPVRRSDGHVRVERQREVHVAGLGHHAVQQRRRVHLRRHVHRAADRQQCRLGPTGRDVRRRRLAGGGQ